MDILETHAYHRRQRRNKVQFTSIYSQYFFISSSTLLSETRWKGDVWNHNLNLLRYKNLMHLSLFFLFVHFYQSCALFLSLLPFFLSAALYFYLWTPASPPSIMSAGVKSAPVLLLAAVVLSWNGGQSVLGVVGGLVFSAVGDCCLVWPELFLHGKRWWWMSSKNWAFFSFMKGLLLAHASLL